MIETAQTETAQTETAQSEKAQTETARPNRPDRNGQSEKSCSEKNTLKHMGVRTTLRLAYHGCKILAHTSKIRQVKRTQMVAAARFAIHVFVAFSDSMNRRLRNSRANDCEV